MLLTMSAVTTEYVRAHMGTDNDSLEREVGWYSKLMSLPTIKLVHTTFVTWGNFIMDKKLLLTSSSQTRPDRI
jgi:hypothetical protein